MFRRTLVLLLTMVLTLSVCATCVYETTDRSSADKVVYYAKDQSEADIVVRLYDNCNAAEGRGWAYCDDVSEADLVIYVTDERSEADTVVYLTDY